MIYLDNAATTRPHPDVVAAMEKTLTVAFGNPSSAHGLGMEAYRLVEEARKRIALTLGVERQELIFTSGGTEANNLALLGTAQNAPPKRRRILTLAIEHDSVLQPLAHLERHGFAVEMIPLHPDGRFRPEGLRALLTPDVFLVSMGLVNNEVGTWQDVETAGQILQEVEPKPLFHIDAIQAWGKVSLRPAFRYGDLVSLSGHKIHGPKGVGVLWKRPGVVLTPLLFGGGQEAGLRSGTENVPGILGLGKAAELLTEVESRDEDLLARKMILWEETQKHLGDRAAVNGPSPEEGAPHILNISVAGMGGSVLVEALSQKGVLLSTGSACSTRHMQSGRVHRALGLPPERGASALRLSLSRDTAVEDLKEAARILGETVRELGPIMRRRR
ncbi:MAG: cysteine desulfurase family protein [Bacillota bacterium]|nr:cysteine desulfurase family protein [Bacillota bacterium]